MTQPIAVIVGALGAQGSSVLSALLTTKEPHYKIRALTSNATSPEAIRLANSGPNIEVVQTDLSSPNSLLAAFTGASVIFANTVFQPNVFLSQGAKAAEELEASHGLNIVQAASKISSTLQHFIWSTLPDADGLTDGKYKIPHFQSKIPAEKYLLDPANGLVGKTTFLRVGMYRSNLIRVPYTPVFVKEEGKYIMTLPCSPSTLIPFIGEETPNIGLIVEAIVRQPERTLGRYVLGVSEYLTAAGWASALSTAAKIEVSFSEATLEDYESRWGDVGTEIGLMVKFIEEFQEGSYTGGLNSSLVVTPGDLGVQDHLHSTEDCLRKFDWAEVFS
ncbi:HSCARG dehydrogenase [Aspergillus ustus]|uniref:HSCARG dehydrogenase n=1 Tax=Aspergillus ustus TaxID=40382 RepID=A0A0C1E2F6_ASPUT|nr:HSCARG dehydrogenase [Aspergillus ustus]